MNLREGTRRLALVFGGVGAIVGGWGSYEQLQALLLQRARHTSFERLANSEVVQQERTRLMSPEIVSQPEEQSANASDKWEKYRVKGWVSLVNRDGIGTIAWGKDYSLTSIETDDGQKLYPVQAPSAWSYLLVVILPVVGFFIPWGTVRTIGWVGAGFFQ